MMQQNFSIISFTQQIIPSFMPVKTENSIIPSVHPCYVPGFLLLQLFSRFDMLPLNPVPVFISYMSTTLNTFCPSSVYTSLLTPKIRCRCQATPRIGIGNVSRDRDQGRHRTGHVELRHGNNKSKANPNNDPLFNGPILLDDNTTHMIKG